MFLNNQFAFFQSFHQWVNIVLLVNDICTLVDVVIVDLIQAYLISRVALSHGGGCNNGCSSEGRTFITIVI
jgi:hypothetical protein